MRRQRLLWQITLPMVLVMMAAMTAATWYAADALRGFFLDQTKADLRIRAELVAKQIAPPFRGGDYARLNEVCLRIGKESATRITVIDKSGRVLADSTENPDRMDNHATRPEVAAGLAGRTGSSIRFSHTVKQNMLYLAQPLTESGNVDGVLRLSIPITALDRALHSVVAKIVGSATLLVLIASLITLTVSRRITHPLEKMRASAERFARGELARTINLAHDDHASTEMADLAEALNRMAAQLNSRIRTITEQRNELEAVFTSMVEAVLVVDNEERIISLNRAAGKLLAIPAAEVRGKPILEVLRNPDLFRFVRRTLKAGGEQQEEEIVLRDESGGDIFFQAYGILLGDASGHSLGALIVLNDVTRLRRLENMRRDFVANVSHELRTPITAIKGFVETLRDGAVSCPEDAERFLNIILKHADRLNAIVGDLLTLSRIEKEGESGEILLEPGSVNKVLHNAIETCLAQAQAKNITLALQCQEGLKATINEPLLEQAVINLVVNAIKYSAEQSEVRVTGAVMPGSIRITVQDHGIGIAREHLPRLFERFYRSDKARSRNLGGTGLGLAIVKHIIQAHQGTVRVESIPGKGTTFTVDLPA